LLKEYQAIATSRAIKAYICFCLDEEDSFEDEINDCLWAELAVLKSSQSQYIFSGSYQQWDSNWEQMSVIVKQGDKLFFVQ